ncbi:MAG: hypothetical protein JXA50_00300 [Deltaproteobacteria bacterium]|nr:hypothetical protein [Deltaproteobacteria bacterium]
MPDFIIVGGEEVEVWMYNFIYQMEVRGKKKTNNIYTLESLTVTLWPFPEYIAQTTQPIDIWHIPVPVTFEGRANNYTQIQIDKISGHKADASHQFPEQFEITPSQLEGVTNTAGQGGEGYSCTYRFPQNFEVFPNFPITLSLRVAPEKTLGCNKTFHWQPFKGASGPSLDSWENDWEGAVVGYVYDAETLEPLTDFPVHAQVYVLEEYGSARTDSNGKFQIAIDLHELKKGCIDDLFIYAGEYYDQASTTQGYKEDGKGKLSICKGKFTPYSFYLEPVSTQEEQGEVPSPPPAEEANQPQEEPQIADVYFPQRIKTYPSSSIAEKEAAHVEVFVGTRYSSVENVRLLVRISEINWQEEVLFPSLKEGASQSRRIDLPELSLPPGVNSKGYKIEAFLDPDGNITEKTKANNKDFVYIEVVPIQRQLKIAKISVSPSQNEYAEGDTITVTGEVENIGNADLENVEVAFLYNKRDPHHVDLQKIGGQTVTIGKKSTKTASLNWSVKKADYIYTDIYCIVDPHNKIEEQDESESLHSATVGIAVKKKEVTEKPIEGKPLVEGVDLAIEDRDTFLEKQNFMASDYLGVWVHNNGNKSARGQVHLTASWIETDSKGKQRAVTQGLCQIGDTINQGSSKLFKIYFKTLSNKGFMMSNHVKLAVDVYPKEDANPSNNSAIFRIGDFDTVASQLEQAEQQEKEEYFTKPDIAVVNITNTEPPLKVGAKRVFTVVVRNVSQLDAENIEMNCVVRPKGSGRPHPELGWKEFKEVAPKIKAGSDSSLSIEYTPIRKGVYEIVASIGSVKWQGMQTSDADQSNNHMMKYFGIETSVDAETGGETTPSGVGVDLAATDIWIDNKTPNVGEVISGGFVVHNYSPVALKNIEWKVYSNADEVAAGTITEIGAGASYTVNASSEADQEGTFTIKAIVDPHNKIPETNENNNTITKQLTITSTSQPISLPKVDVAVVSVSLSESHIKVGQDTKVQATVKNLGSNTVNAVPVAFMVGDVNFSIQVIDSLAPGETKTVTAPLIGLMGGTYTITVIADRRESIKETNEGNNQRDTTLVVEKLIQVPLLNN